jgi:hypothetical protein
MLASIEKPTLLIYDSVPSEGELLACLPPAGLPVHVLVTTTSRDWTGRHVVREVSPLGAKDARAIVEGVTGPVAAGQYGDALVHRAGGIAVRLRADCEYVGYELRHGRKPSLGRKLDHSTEASFGRAFALLDSDGKLALRVAVLFNPAHVPREELEQRLASQGWDEARKRLAVDAASDRRLVTVAGDFLLMHGLVAEFVRTRTEPRVPEGILAKHRDAFVQAALVFIANPANTQLREQLAAYPSRIADWESVGLPTHPGDLHAIGRGLAEVGRFREAQKWYERTIALKEKGDDQGRVDHEDLGRSVHEVAYCLSSLAARGFSPASGRRAWARLLLAG